MLIRNRKAFTRGIILMASFIAVFILFFTDVFPAQEGDGKTNGLVYADHLFNTLSKGSSSKYLINDGDPEDMVQNRIAGIKHNSVEVTIHFKNPDIVPVAVEQVKKAGLEAVAVDKGLTIKGDLKVLLTAMVNDSISLYNNKADEVAARYGKDDGLKVVENWHRIAKNMIKPLQKIDLVSEASVVNAVLTKGIELGYNFYGITPQKVSDNKLLVSGFLLFYVIYTMWYGFAIFELFEGIGLSMKKGAKKAEV